MRRCLSSALNRGKLPVLAALLMTACLEVNSPTAVRSPDRGPYDPADVAPQPTFDKDAGPSLRFSVVPGPGEIELVVNGGFELNGGVNTSNLTGWTVFNQAFGDQIGWVAQSGTLSPAVAEQYPVPAPPTGSFSAMSTQLDIGTHIISQVITLPENGNARLSFRLFIGNRAGDFFSPPTLSFFRSYYQQQFRMDIMDPTADIMDVEAGVLLNVYQTQPGDAAVSAGYLTVTADLSDFDGKSVRLRFAESDNLLFFHVGIDDVSVIASTGEQPPVANAGPDQTIECTGATTGVQLDGTATAGTSDIVSSVWTEGDTQISTDIDPAINLAHGTHTLTLTVTDAEGRVATDEVTIDVVDTTAPAVTLSATPVRLWPANHKYLSISLSLTYSDACDPATSLTVVATAVSSDPDDAPGDQDGNTTGDVKAGTATSSNANPTVTFNPLTDQLSLRAERAGTTPRNYTITVTVTDSHGNSNTATATVAVDKIR